MKGCSDIDGDFMPDEYDDDADGDGIRNEMERAASSGTILYDPYNAASTPLDSDKDTLPDVLDDDNDNDGWPDDVELDRGSDAYDASSTPFNMYMNMDTGFFYRGGLSGNSFSSEYDPESFEISLSALSEIVFEELVIPFLLVPIYFAIFFARRGEYKKCLKTIEDARTASELVEIEVTINTMVKEKKINLEQKFSLFNEHWTPKIIAELNDYQIKIVKVEGDFVWHDHSDTDEFFFVIEGTLFIEFESETMELNAGELYVVPKGVQHRPFAHGECKVMLIEPRGVVNTGEASSDLTASNDVWI